MSTPYETAARLRAKYQSPSPRQAAQAYRAKGKDWGWANWYINRGHLPLNPTKADLRRLSWRRKH